MKLRCKIVDKRKHDGWFSMSYFVTLKIVDSRVSNSPSQEVEIPLSQYYDLKLGGIYTMTFYKHSNGHYYMAEE
jgi:hypothetical protein